MEMERCRKTELEFETHGFEDSNQFPENQEDLTTCIFAETKNAEKENDISHGINANDNLPELHETMDPEPNKANRRYNLRKSLAWDTAFFTSAGVLDPEELSSMIIGTDKGEKHILPRIQEDISITGSTESISTLESENLNLETLEEDLFVDIRASIQRSSKKTSNLMNSDSKKAAMEVDSASISSLKKEDFASQNQYPKPGSKKTSGLQTARMSKSLPKQNGKQVGKAFKQNSGHLQMTSAATIGEKNPTLTKTTKSNSISTSTTTAKRDSMGPGRGKSECGSLKTVTGSSKAAQPPKASGCGRKILPRPAESSKSSLFNSSTTSKLQSARSSTSGDSSGSISSETPTKSSLMTARRNLSRSGNVSTGPSGSVPKTPSKAVPKNKPPPSSLSAYLMSTKIPSSISPASSISEWSSVSSSSSSVVNQRFNNPRFSVDTSSCKSIDGDATLLHRRNHTAGQTADERRNQGVNLPSNNSKPSPTTGIVQASAKPSGLRMPSPKIGFFDGVKSSARTPSGNQQSPSGLRNVFPRNGTATGSPARNSNSKLKSSKVSRTVTTLASKKPDSQKATSSTSSQEKIHASINPSVSSDVKVSPGISDGVKGNATGEICQKTEKVQSEDGIKQVVEAGTGAMERNLPELNMHNDMGTEDIAISVEGSNISSLEHTNTTDVLANQSPLKNNTHSTGEATEKENANDKFAGEGLIGQHRDTYHSVSGLKYELSNGISESMIPVPATASESATNRSPFSLKNECIDSSQELAMEVADKTAFILPSEQKENS